MPTSSRRDAAQDAARARRPLTAPLTAPLHLLVCLAVTVALALVAGPASAAAPEDPDLVGTVLDSTGARVAGIGVIAFAVDPRDGSSDTTNELGFATSGPDGRYSFTGLDPASLTAAGDPVVRQFKLLFYDVNAYPAGIAGYRALRWADTYLGARSSKLSSTVTVPDGGLAAAPDQVVVRYGGLSITVLSPTGAPVSGSAAAQLFDVDDFGAGTYDTDDDDLVYDDPATPDREPAPRDGLITAQVRGGQSYKILASGVDTDAAAVSTYYLGVFAGGANSLSTAPRIPVTPGAYTAVTVQLRNGLTSISAPRIRGDASFGSTLVADPGSWSHNAGTEYRYQWLRGASVVGTGPAYRVSEADEKAQLRVLVTAYYDDYVGSALSAATGKVGKPARVRARKVGGDYLVTVKAAGKAGKPGKGKKGKRGKGRDARGKVVLLDAGGAAASKTRKLEDGETTLRPRRSALAPYTIAYLGGGGLGTATKAAPRGGKKMKKQQS